jgi:lipopolysaccharide/colanic/teichoic acid biosynthesis glycosyltransferase
MTALDYQKAFEPPAAVPASGPIIWGADARRLHDLFWAARGFQVVRPGLEHDPAGPGLFLLLKPDQALIAETRAWLKRLVWGGGRYLSVRVRDRSRAEYRERVVPVDDAGLHRIERIYNDRVGDVGRVIVTSDARVARAWAALDPAQARWSAVSRDARFGAGSVWRSEGRLFDLAGQAGREAFVTALVDSWRSPGRVIPGVYEWKAGVWVHESARLDPGTRVVGPVWIGAGDEVSSRGPVVGPLAVPDGGPCEAPGSVDWESLALPNFPLTPVPRGRLTRRVSKRGFDVCFALAVLACTAPLYPAAMLLIALEDGRPFFFAHKRQTLGGREFPCWKFRTMIKNAEKLKAQLAAQNVCDGPQFFIARDPRLLKVGVWLRRFQIDELPQFWNVLLGHMSVVGPRPSPHSENQYCPAWREARLSVRPGITGLWQVRRTRLPETDFQEWIRYDLEYVQHQSWRMDLWIIAQTVRTILGGKPPGDREKGRPS